MKRRLLIIAVCLLAGAVVNVAVAWGCALLPVKFSGPRNTVMAGRRMIVWPRERAGAYVFMAVRPTGVFRLDEDDSHYGGELLLPKWVNRARFGSEEGVSIVDSRGWPIPTIVDSRGWPFPTLYSVTTFEGGKPISAGGFPLPTRARPYLLGTTGYALPFRPIWTAFAINTLFYATLLWLLIAGPFAVRRFLRVKRGLCPKCAYPMGESSVCTECGKPLPRRRRMATLT